MEDSKTIAVARRFVRLVQEGEPPSDQQLALGLDELAMAYHQAPDGAPSPDERLRPKTDFAVLYRQLGARFPDHGLYATADPTEPVGENLVGDAIDDLADIITDLEDVMWRFEHVGADDAHWSFKFFFGIHWGCHLRGLQQYLHVKIWCAS